MRGIRKVLKYYQYRTARLDEFINVDSDSKFHDWLAKFAGHRFADNHELYIVQTDDRKVAIWFHDGTIAIGQPGDVVVGVYSGPDDTLPVVELSASPILDS